jgi:hypothetical protein
MRDNDSDNKPDARRSVGTRYPRWKVHLLDSLAERWSIDRAHVIERALDSLLESEGLLPFPTSRAA